MADSAGLCESMQRVAAQVTKLDNGMLDGQACVSYSLFTPTGESTMNANRVVSWKTTKTPSGFEFQAYSFDHNAPTIVHATGTLKTRALAVSKAKEWVRYIKASQQKAS